VAGFLLDTNVLSEFALAQAADERVDRWSKATPEEVLFASILTFAEIRRGIELLPTGKRRDQLEEWQITTDAANTEARADYVWRCGNITPVGKRRIEILGPEAAKYFPCSALPGAKSPTISDTIGA